MRATMSLLGLYNYDNTIFDFMALPEAFDNTFNRDILVKSILTECAELEILYTDPDFFRTALSVWSYTMVDRWTKLYNTTKFDYNPIENYDRKEEWTDKSTLSENGENISTSTVDGTNNAQTSIAAFDNNAIEPRDIVENSGKTTSANTGRGSRNNNNNTTHDGRMHGNIGTTTTQKMIEEERRVSKFSIYEEIINDFKARFCIMVY